MRAYQTLKFLITSLLLALLIAACQATPTTVVSDTSVLPANWHSLKSFRSPSGMIFAHDEAAAEAASGISAEVAADFRRVTAREPSQRVLVIAGSRDWLSDADPCDRLRLAACGAASLQGQPEPTAADLTRECTKVQKEAIDAGLDLQTVLVLKPDTLRGDNLVTDLALPPSAGAAFDWAIVIATPDELATAVRELIDAAMKKENPSIGKRMMMAPLMPWVRGKVVDAA
ncbi:MAG TPA: hypothetical protein VK843_10885, partial [Planctomycetota bacterium]|nr:hypothetical protein [Planctomycetota bacterium]